MRSTVILVLLHAFPRRLLAIIPGIAFVAALGRHVNLLITGTLNRLT